MAILVLALAVGGVAAALLATKGSQGTTLPSTSASRQITGGGDTAAADTAGTNTATTDTTTTTDTTATTDTTTTTNTVPTTTTTTIAHPPNPPPPPGPATTVHQYWRYMNSGNYSAAYALESQRVQRVRGDVAAFVAYETQAASHINVVSVGTPSYQGGVAEVPIDFYAQDTNAVNPPADDTLCRHYVTQARMVSDGGNWYYDGIAANSSTVVASDDPDYSNCHG